MKSMKRQLSVAAILFALPCVAMGQGTSATCKWTAADAWIKRQAEFFDESKRDWTNDSLRTALLAAAGLTAPLKAPVNTGVQLVDSKFSLAASAPAVIDQ